MLCAGKVFNVTLSKVSVFVFCSCLYIVGPHQSMVALSLTYLSNKGIMYVNQFAPYDGLYGN